MDELKKQMMQLDLEYLKQRNPDGLSNARQLTGTYTKNGLYQCIFEVEKGKLRSDWICSKFCQHYIGIFKDYYFDKPPELYRPISKESKELLDTYNKSTKFKLIYHEGIQEFIPKNLYFIPRNLLEN